MNVSKRNGGNSELFVTLSRRNVTQLLEALDRGYAEGTIHRRCEDGTILHVRVEEDADHYKNREPGPGLAPVVHPIKVN